MSVAFKIEWIASYRYQRGILQIITLPL